MLNDKEIKKILENSKEVKKKIMKGDIHIKAVQISKGIGASTPVEASDVFAVSMMMLEQLIALDYIEIKK